MPETIADVVLRMAQQYLAALPDEVEEVETVRGVEESNRGLLPSSEVEQVEEAQRGLPPLARGSQGGSDERSLRRPIPVVPDPNPGSDESNLNSQLIEPQNPDARQADLVPDEARRASGDTHVQRTIESSM